MDDILRISKEISEQFTFKLVRTFLSKERIISEVANCNISQINGYLIKYKDNIKSIIINHKIDVKDIEN